MIQALIFDCDGTLVDTESPDYDALKEIYAEHGAELPLDLWIADLGTVGAFDRYGELERRAGRALERAKLLADHEARYRQRVVAQPLLPGVRELLHDARAAGLRLAVASSAGRAWVEGWLARHGIRELFDCVRTRDDVHRVKPDPELFLSAAACLGVPPAACLVIEDSPNGVRAAAAAGMRCVAVPIPLLADVELPPAALRLASLEGVALAELLERVLQDDERHRTTEDGRT
jgi:HAD superfamily hydrolase (TIGR01509 family)